MVALIQGVVAAVSTDPPTDGTGGNIDKEWISSIREEEDHGGH